MATEDPRFNYPEIPNAPTTVAQLDDLWKLVVSAGTGTWASIVAGIKIILLAALYFARSHLITQEQLRAKQKYEQDQAAANQGEADQGEPK